MALDFNPQTSDMFGIGSGALVSAPDTLFDRATVEKSIVKEIRASTDEAEQRRLIAQVLSDEYQNARTCIAEFFTDHPYETQKVIKSYSFIADQVVQIAAKTVIMNLHPNPKPKMSEEICLVAVGGYGRAEMAPFSDVDLLFLSPNKTTAWSDTVVESILYVLWDVKLKIGHSTRTIDDCISMGKSDQTVRTALLESRFVAGEPKLYDLLTERLESELFADTGPEFVELKLAEREERHERQGGQRYMLEPNVKEGKGGLRDLQSMYWIMKYLGGAQAYSEMIAQGYFTQEELDNFIEAENFLWTVRCHLHLVAKRAREQLTFDAQVEVAARLNYHDIDGRLGVEQFMQDYFRRATLVGELTRIFLTKLEAENLKTKPTFGERLKSVMRRRKSAMAEGYEMEHGRLNVSNPEVFFKDPINILRIFEEALRSEILVHPDTMRWVTSNLDLIDDKVRANPAAQEIFMRTLLDYGNPERALRRMNELGVLGKFIPEFERIVAMMQFNVYHHYTVDEHTIQCISILAKIERGELIEDLPIASSILKAGINRRVLYVALLLHDIGKGLPEDHSVAGGRIARAVAPRLGLNEQECDTVVWLIEQHLTMSDVAQKRDLSDPRTVRDFARTVQSMGRLNLLITLTVCDIRGVGPGTLNQWKTSLLRSLYTQTQAALQGVFDQDGVYHRVDEAKEKVRSLLPAEWSEEVKNTQMARHYDPYWQGLDTDTQLTFMDLLRRIDADDIQIDISANTDRAATRACFVLQDHPGIFPRITGALALVGANVIDARSYTTKDGYAVFVFWVQDINGKAFEESRLDRFRQMILKSLDGKVVPREAIKDRDKIKKRERDFVVPTEVTFDNEGSEIYTIIEVDTRDRPGLLYDLTRTLAASNIYVANAVIATYGAQAVDVFYVKDMFGLKLHSKAKRRALEEKIRKSIDAGAERAVQ